MKAVIIAIGICLLSSPVRGQNGLVDKDLWGFVFPTECAGKIDDVQLPVVIVEPSELPVGLIALCDGCGYAAGARILLSREIPEWQRPSAIKHEKCHRKLWLMGLNPYWHKSGG